MAVALSAEDFRLFVAHIKKYEKANVCPVCGSQSWGVPGLESASVGPHVGSTTPAVVMICAVCFYMQRFAWFGIKNFTGDEKPMGVSFGSKK